MKCQICGNENFIHPSTDTILSQGDQNLRIEYFVCTKCGHIETYGTNIVKKYFELKEKIKFLEKENKFLQEENDIMDAQEFDASEYENKIKSLKRTNEKVNDERIYKINETMIKFYETILERGSAPKDAKYGENLMRILENKHQIQLLQKEINGYYDQK